MMMRIHKKRMHTVSKYTKEKNRNSRSVRLEAKFPAMHVDQLARFDIARIVDTIGRNKSHVTLTAQFEEEENPADCTIAT
jgi:hypothetical protein